jgi:hypothetical protein
LEAYSANGTLLGSFSGSGSGSNSIYANGIRFIRFHDTGGTVGISNLTYDFDPVPEPTTVALFGLGLVGAGLARRRWRK